MRISDWSSDVCASDLLERLVGPLLAHSFHQLGDFLRGLGIHEPDIAMLDHEFLGRRRIARDPDRWVGLQIGRAHVTLQSLSPTSYPAFCLKKKKKDNY